jgi:FHS family glucose/mannose:H+ symporter-like MFS transporter
VPFRLCLFAALAVGVESSLGGWLTTFAGRTTHTASLAVSVNSAFWAGLLISRAVHSTSHLRWLNWGPGLPIHTLATVVATGCLLTEPRGATLLFIALLAGLGLGPLYPLSLSIALPRYRPTAIFLLAGAGSALFPWITGVVSTKFGHLRTGLIVPCVAAIALLMTGFWVGQESRPRKLARFP